MALVHMILASEKIQGMYFSYSDFIKDFKEHNLRSPFRLAEPVFQELIGTMSLDKELCKQINDEAVILLMSAADKKEIESLLIMAETLLDG